jgi:hypothetical protein
MRILLTAYFLIGIQAFMVPHEDEGRIARGVNCKIVTGVLGDLKFLGPPATTFCRAFLHIPNTVTVPYTITPST